MRNVFVHGLALAVVSSLSGCPDDDDDDGVGTLRWRAPLQGEPGWEQLGGEGEVIWVETTNQFTSSVVITGDEPGAVRPWHLHFDSCEAGGPIVGADQDYPRLVIGEDGTDSQTVTIGMRIEPDAPYHINVHLSDAELETIIACADVITGEGRPRDDDDGY
jgi:superoxide dismutase, Cu-Zn family